MAYENKNGTYTTKRITCGVTGKSLTKTFATMDAALDFERRAMEAKVEGIALATITDNVLSERTLYAVTRRILREYYAFKTDATHKTVEGHLNRLCVLMGHQSLISDVLTTDTIARFITDQRERGMSVSYCNSFLQYFRRMSQSCVRWGYISKEIDIPPSFKRERTRFEWCTVEEVEQLLHHMPKHYHPLVRFTNATGLRASEVLAVTPADIQGERVRVTLGKGRKLRYVPLSATAVEAVNEPEWIQGQPVFRVKYPAWAYAMDQASKRIGKKVTPHTLRHSFASRLAQKGLDIVRLQELMGHADISQTRRYMHLHPDWMSSVHNMLD